MALLALVIGAGLGAGLAPRILENRRRRAAEQSGITVSQMLEHIVSGSPVGIVVVDTYVSPDPGKAAEFNRLEKLRDPSHARSLALAELKALYRTAGLGEPRTSFYELRDTVTNLLARSFPNPGDDKKIIAMFETAISDDSLGIPVQRPAGSKGGDTLEYAYPVAILAAGRR